MFYQHMIQLLWTEETRRTFEREAPDDPTVTYSFTILNTEAYLTMHCFLKDALY